MCKKIPDEHFCFCRCTECQKTFQYPSQLQNHMMKHKDIRPFICSECGMEFIQSHHLKQHTLTHKVGSEQTFEKKKHSCISLSLKKGHVMVKSINVDILSVFKE